MDVVRGREEDVGPLPAQVPRQGGGARQGEGAPEVHAPGEIARSLCAGQGAGCEFVFERRVPAVVNHPREAALAARVAAEVTAPGLALPQEPAMASEDFAWMLQARPGAYAFIGNGDGDHRHPGHGEGPCMLHNPSYDFNDALIPLGGTYWVRLAQQWLAAPHPDAATRNAAFSG